MGLKYQFTAILCDEWGEAEHCGYVYICTPRVRYWTTEHWAVCSLPIYKGAGRSKTQLQYNLSSRNTSISERNGPFIAGSLTWRR